MRNKKTLENYFNSNSIQVKYETKKVQAGLIPSARV